MAERARMAKEDLILRMEAELTSGFNSVQPNPEFVRRLRKRLTNTPDIILEVRPKLPAILVILVSFTTGIAILWVINKIRRMIFRICRNP